MLVDLHVHTRLSSDSNVAPEQYLEAIARHPAPLGAICFTEHRLFPIDAELDASYAEMAQRFGVHIFKGIEADTDLGHLLLFGVNPAVRHRFHLDSRMIRAEHLIEVVHGEGGVAIPAHPFRDSGYGARLDDLLARLGPALAVVEAINGQNTHEQNAAALAVAEKLGLTAVGGSDAHFSTPNWFLTCATELEREVATVEELCVELRAGRARPYHFPRLDPPPR
ncbi:MAG TPA: PHP-associated domain-containing protein [Candidatus Binataceae bacterium]|nr:PHP-associated domain-containing protein [Candidatus Binataceae bacterium]